MGLLLGDVAVMPSTVLLAAKLRRTVLSPLTDRRSCGSVW